LVNYLIYIISSVLGFMGKYTRGRKKSHHSPERFWLRVAMDSFLPEPAKK
jgi:hypothetical protein